MAVYELQGTITLFLEIEVSWGEDLTAEALLSRIRQDLQKKGYLFLEESTVENFCSQFKGYEAEMRGKVTITIKTVLDEPDGCKPGPGTLAFCVEQDLSDLGYMFLEDSIVENFVVKKRDLGANEAIAKALNIARKAHDGQVDSGGETYIWHPVYLALQMKTAEEKVVALLHDVIEDSEITLNDLSDMGFSDVVLAALDALTRRDEESYSDYIKRVKQNPLAVKIKIKDLEHNCDISRIPSPGSRDKEKIEKYRRVLNDLKKKGA